MTRTQRPSQNLNVFFIFFPIHVYNTLSQIFTIMLQNRNWNNIWKIFISHPMLHWKIELNQRAQKKTVEGRQAWAPLWSWRRYWSPLRWLENECCYRTGTLEQEQALSTQELLRGRPQTSTISTHSTQGNGIGYSQGKGRMQLPAAEGSDWRSESHLPK